MSSSGLNTAGKTKRRIPAKRPPGRPPGSDGQETRKRLLEAALGAFAKHGYDAMSVRDLARELGVSHNLVHHHCGSKWDLWKAALEHGFSPTARELWFGLKSGSQRLDFEEAVRDGVKALFTVVAHYPEVTTIVADESVRGGPRLDFIFDHYLNPGAELLREFIANAQGREMRYIDVRAATLFFFSGVTALFTHRGLANKLGGPTPTSEQELARYADTVAELIAHGLLKPAKAAAGTRRSKARQTTRARRDS